MSTLTEAIRQAVAENGRLSVDVATLTDDDDLYLAGLSSHASINVMLAIEDELDIEFPEQLLRRSTFQSVASVRAALESIDAPAGA